MKLTIPWKRPCSPLLFQNFLIFNFVFYFFNTRVVDPKYLTLLDVTISHIRNRYAFREHWTRGGGGGCSMKFPLTQSMSVTERGSSVLDMWICLIYYDELIQTASFDFLYFTVSTKRSVFLFHWILEQFHLKNVFNVSIIFRLEKKYYLLC